MFWEMGGRGWGAEVHMSMCMCEHVHMCIKE